MSDVFTKAERSEVMSLIRSAGNKATELRLIQIFRADGITGWRRGCSLALTPRSSKAQGPSAKPKTPNPRFKTLRRVRSSGRVRPDFVFPRRRVAVFVDGCFWHGCPKHGAQPKTNAAFWRAKISGNKARDRRVNYALRKRGWTVLRIWQHELTRKNEAKLLGRLAPLYLQSRTMSRVSRAGQKSEQVFVLFAECSCSADRALSSQLRTLSRM